MTKRYGIYEQGALFSREDFDPYKTIKYLFDIYGIKLSNKLEEVIRYNKVCEADLNFLCDVLEVKPEVRNLQAICAAALNPYELNDIFMTDADIKFENEMVHAKLFSDINGIFMFDDEDRPHEEISGEYMMVCFNIPHVWDIRNAIIPGDKRIAVFQIQDATKALLKDDIDWEARLGSLYAVGQGT